jgi:hypothetical protein
MEKVHVCFPSLRLVISTPAGKLTVLTAVFTKCYQAFIYIEGGALKCRLEGFQPFATISSPSRFSSDEGHAAMPMFDQVIKSRLDSSGIVNGTTN